jgi:hypothetical protein
LPSARSGGRDRGLRELQHGLGDFPLAHDHLVGAKSQKMIDPGVEMRAGDDRQVRVFEPGLLYDLARRSEPRGR